MFPRLAGQHAAYVARQLADYKSGRRKNGTMQPMVEDLSAADFAALGAYFESRTPVAHPVDDPELSAVGRFVFQRGNPYSGVAACAGCHGATGAGTPTLPRLAGQHAQYTENQLKAFNKRERTNDNAVMHGIASKLSELSWAESPPRSGQHSRTKQITSLSQLIDGFVGKFETGKLCCKMFFTRGTRIGPL